MNSSSQPNMGIRVAAIVSFSVLKYWKHNSQPMPEPHCWPRSFYTCLGSNLVKVGSKPEAPVPQWAVCIMQPYMALYQEAMLTGKLASFLLNISYYWGVHSLLNSRAQSWSILLRTWLLSCSSSCLHWVSHSISIQKNVDFESEFKAMIINFLASSCFQVTCPRCSCKSWARSCEFSKDHSWGHCPEHRVTWDWIRQPLGKVLSGWEGQITGPSLITSMQHLFKAKWLSPLKHPRTSCPCSRTLSKDTTGYYCTRHTLRTHRCYK